MRKSAGLEGILLTATFLHQSLLYGGSRKENVNKENIHLHNGWGGGVGLKTLK